MSSSASGTRTCVSAVPASSSRANGNFEVDLFPACSVGKELNVGRGARQWPYPCIRCSRIDPGSCIRSSSRIPASLQFSQAASTPIVASSHPVSRIPHPMVSSAEFAPVHTHCQNVSKMTKNDASEKVFAHNFMHLSGLAEKKPEGKSAIPPCCSGGGVEAGPPPADAGL